MSLKRSSLRDTQFLWELIVNYLVKVIPPTLKEKFINELPNIDLATVKGKDKVDLNVEIDLIFDFMKDNDLIRALQQD